MESLNVTLNMENLSEQEKEMFMKLLNKAQKVLPQSFIVIKKEETSLNVEELKEREWKIGESLYIPLSDGRNIEFVVAHVEGEELDEHDEYTDRKTYFVSRQFVGKSSMTNMEEFLDEFTKLIPENLLSIMNEMEQICDDKKLPKRKICIPSYGNVTGSNRCTGRDDMQFTLFYTEAGRVMDDEGGETCWWWTSSPFVANSSYFMYVNASGGAGYNSNASGGNAVRPCFSI